MQHCVVMGESPQGSFIDVLNKVTTCIHAGQRDMELQIKIRRWKGRTHCGKRRKCLLPAFSSCRNIFKMHHFKVYKNIRTVC